jgi:hypothetical protein
VGFLPESPRWLIANARREEAVEILAKIRSGVPLSDPALAAELEQLDAIVVAAGHKRYRFHNVAFSCYSNRLRLGCRVSLAVGIMMMMVEWTGTLATTVYASTLFQQVGFSADKASWLRNTFGILSTAASMLTVDRLAVASHLLRLLHSRCCSFLSKRCYLFYRSLDQARALFGIRRHYIPTSRQGKQVTCLA